MSTIAQPVQNARPVLSGLYYGWANVAVANLAIVGTRSGTSDTRLGTFLANIQFPFCP